MTAAKPKQESAPQKARYRLTKARRAAIERARRAGQVDPFAARAAHKRPETRERPAHTKAAD